MSESDRPVYVHPLVVGTTMCEAIAHGRQQIPIHWLLTVEAKNSDDAAHTKLGWLSRFWRMIMRQDRNRAGAPFRNLPRNQFPATEHQRYQPCLPAHRVWTATVT